MSTLSPFLQDEGAKEQTPRRVHRHAPILCAYNTTKRAYLNKHIKNVQCSVNVGKEISLDESGDKLLEKHTQENNNETPSSPSKGNGESSTQNGKKIILLRVCLRIYLAMKTFST